METPKKKIGRPTNYTEDLPDRLLDYFDVPSNDIEESVDADGNVKTRVVAREMPSLAGFCCMLGIHRQTLLEWGAAHKMFGDAIKVAKEHQERILLSNGLAGATPPAMTIFVMKNLAGYRDQHTVENTGANGGPIQTVNYESPRLSREEWLATFAPK